MIDRRDGRDARRHGHLLLGSTCTTASGRWPRATAWAGPRTRCASCARRWRRASRSSAGRSRPGVRITYSTDSGVYPHAPGRQAVRDLRAVRDGAARGDPVRDRRRGRVPGLVGPRRDAAAGPVRRPRGRRRRPAGRRHGCSSGRRSCIKGGRVVVDRRARRTGALRSCCSGIDHLVIAVRDPSRRRRRSSSATLGLAFTGGGRHEAMGDVQPARVPRRHVSRADRRVRPRARRCGERVVPRWAARRSPSSTPAARGCVTFAVATDDVAGDVALLRAAGSPIAAPVAGRGRGPTARSSAGRRRSRRPWAPSGRRS